MISREIIQKILTAGCMAPSGGNSQPWEFEVDGSLIKVIAKPERDHPVLNALYRGTWIAHGALIENICLAASSCGIATHVSIFPDNNREFITAHIQLSESGAVPADDLAAFIPERATNRKPYSDKVVSADIQKQLAQSVGVSTDVGVEFISDREVIGKIAQSLSVSERIMFENKILHGLLFKEMVFNKKQEAKKGGGLLLTTLELQPPQWAMLHFIQYWPVMKIAAKLGVARLIAKENAQNHRSCGLLCVVKVSKNKEAFLGAGRSIERLWLSATKNNLSVQLNSGLFFFKQAIDEKTATGVFSEVEQKEINAGYDTVASLCDAKDGMITTILRIGYGEKPSTKSFKPAPVIHWIN
ncbi:MAG: hypothetical protein WCQ60_00525 [bacterium]